MEWYAFQLTISLPMVGVQDHMYVLLMAFEQLDFGRKPLVLVKVMSLTRTEVLKARFSTLR